MYIDYPINCIVFTQARFSVMTQAKCCFRLFLRFNNEYDLTSLPPLEKKVGDRIKWHLCIPKKNLFLMAANDSAVGYVIELLWGKYRKLKKSESDL